MLMGCGTIRRLRRLSKAEKEARLGRFVLVVPRFVAQVVLAGRATSRRSQRAFLWLLLALNLILLLLLLLLLEWPVRLLRRGRLLLLLLLIRALVFSRRSS